MAHFTIRQAKAADHDRIVDMALRFLSATRYGFFIRGVTIESMHTFVQLVREMGTILLLEGDGPVGVVGMLGLIVMPHPMTGREEAAEVAWWIEPEHRGGRGGYHLLCGAEEWARHRGVECLKMVAPADSQTGQFYEALGYQAVETVYQKFLDAAVERKVATLTDERLDVAH